MEDFKAPSGRVYFYNFLEQQKWTLKFVGSDVADPFIT